MTQFSIYKQIKQKQFIQTQTNNEKYNNNIASFDSIPFIRTSV